MNASSGLRRATHGHARVTYAELFFDLIFVFAVTQLSHALLHHPGWHGAVQAATLFLAAWWVWVFTAWATNWLDPDQPAVRWLLFGMMAAGMLMAVSIPDAFGATGLGFALAHVAMQLGRTGFTWWALGPSKPNERRNFLRILLWLAAAAPFWLLGAAAEGDARLALWLVALAIEYLSPALSFRLPGLGRSTLEDWQVEGGHMAERCGLFLIIALGESILITGATFAERPWTVPAALAFAAAFGGTLAMWWVYFDTGLERGVRHITQAAQPGAMARAGYTYLHAVIVAGVVATAAGDEMLLAHADHVASRATLALAVGGPAGFLLGTGWFKALALGWFPLSHRVGLGALALLLPLGLILPAWGLALGTTLALVLVAVWERRSLPASAR